MPTGGCNGSGRVGVSLSVDRDTEFSDLVRAHQDAIYSIALRLTGCGADAEDAAQETFLRAYRSLSRFDDDRRAALKVRPWLAAITLNVCRNRARSASRRPGEALGAEHDAAAHDRRGGAEAAEDGETAAELAAALRRLPDVQRRSIVLHHGGGLTYAEVGLALGRREGTVKADVHRGLATLRSILPPPEALT